jgi:hypothetical protein
MNSITWTFDSDGSTAVARGFSFPWSVSPNHKTRYSINFLDFVFDNKLTVIDSGEFIAIKSPNGKWHGELTTFKTHQGLIIHSKDSFSVTLNKDTLNSLAKDYEGHKKQTLHTDAIPMDTVNTFVDRNIVEYDHQNFKDSNLSFGEQIVGYPYFTASNPIDNGAFTEADGRFFHNALVYSPLNGDTDVGTWTATGGQWVGSSNVIDPGSCVRINIEPQIDVINSDITKIETIFQHPSGGSYFGPRTFSTDNKPLAPWSHYNNYPTYSRRAVSVFIEKPSNGGYGIRNIDGKQLITPKLANAPLTRRPAMWWGTASNCTARLDNTANGDDQILTLSMESVAINSVDSFHEGSSFDTSDYVKVSTSSATQFPQTTDPKVDGQVAYFEGFTGRAAYKLNGFRRVEVIHGDNNTIKVWANGGLFDDEGNSLVDDPTDGATGITMTYCGDGYGNLVLGSSGGSSEQGPSYTFAWSGVNTQPAAMSKHAFRGHIHDGTPGGSLDGINTKRWNGFSGGILGVQGGITDAGWTASDAEAGEGFGDAGEELTITMDRFKCTRSNMVNYLPGTDDQIYIGGWIPQRISWPGKIFGCGNGDKVKLRVWDPYTQAFWAAKFVTANGTPIALLDDYYGGDELVGSLGESATTYGSTGWSAYFERTLGGEGQLLTPLNNVGIGLQLEAITTSN